MKRKYLAPALAMMALAGCNMSRSDLKKKADDVTATVFNTNNERPGRVFEPKYCKLDTAIIARPLGEPVVNNSVWEVADLQSIPADARQALEANGIRVGIITGNLPADINEAFQPSPPLKETQWVHIAIPEGERTPIVVGAKSDAASLLLNHRGKVNGKDYQDAEGRIIVSPMHSGSKSVTLRLVPEIHHGETRRTIVPLQPTTPFGQQELKIKDGQTEDVLSELAISIDLLPGQTLVLGCRAEQTGSLGRFLFTRSEPNNDQLFQSVLLIQATRNHLGEIPLKPIDEPNELPDLAVKPTPIPQPLKESKTP